MTGAEDRADASSGPRGGRGPWLRAVVFDCQDYRTLADFYAAALGVGFYKDLDGWVELEAGKAGIVMGFQPAEGDLAPRSRIRLDIEVDDLDAGQAFLESRGATFVRSVHFTPEEEHRVMADPEGNELNIVLPFPDGW